MHVIVNGRPHDLDERATLAGLVARVAPDPRGIAVAVNGGVVPARTWPDVELVEGDQVEVVTAHQGG